MQTRLALWRQFIIHSIRSPGWILFLSFMLLFSLTYAGVFRQDDEHILAARAQSLALWGDLEEPQVYGNTRLQALIPLGDKATQIEPAHSFLAAPLYRLGIAFGGGGVQMMFLLNIVISALSVTAVYAITRALGYKPNTASWTAVLFGAGTMIWPFSATLYRDSLAMLLAAVGMWLWIQSESSALSSRRWRLFLILALPAGLLAKNTNMALLLAIGVAIGWNWVWRKLQQGHRKDLLLGLGALLGLAAAWAVLVPSSGPLARFSASYMLDLTQFFIHSLKLDLLGALAGPLISPAKSILLFSPPLLVGLAGAPLAWRRHRRYLLAGLLMSLFLFLGQGLFYRENWAGGYGWGLRYTLPLIPVLLPLLLGPVVDSLLDKGRSGWTWLVTILGLGASVQVAGVLTNWQRMYADWVSAGLDPYQPAAVWDGRMNGILAGWKLLLAPHQWLTAWVRLLQEGNPSTWFLPALILGSGALVFVVWKSKKETAMPRIAVSLWVCVLPVVAVLTFYRADPAWGGDRAELQAAIEWVNQRAKRQESVVIDAYATPLWMTAMNNWHSAAHWYSLPYEIPAGSEPPTEALSAISKSLFETLLSEAGGLWYMLSPEAPDYAYHRESQWLIDQAGLAVEQQFGRDGEVKVWGIGDVE